MRGEDAPRATFPTVVGTPRVIHPVVGRDVDKECDAATIYSPFKSGFIQNRADFEKLFRHIFEVELHVDLERRAIVVSEPVNDPPEHRRDALRSLPCAVDLSRDCADARAFHVVQDWRRCDRLRRQLLASVVRLRVDADAAEPPADGAVTSRRP